MVNRCQPLLLICMIRQHWKKSFKYVFHGKIKYLKFLKYRIFTTKQFVLTCRGDTLCAPPCVPRALMDMSKRVVPRVDTNTNRKRDISVCQTSFNTIEILKFW